MTHRPVECHLFGRKSGSIAKFKDEHAEARNSTGEVDFLYDFDGEVVAVEVKAETNLKAKSLASFAQRYGIERSLRLSLSSWKDQGWVTNVPLYAANLLPDGLPKL